MNCSRCKTGTIVPESGIYLEGDIESIEYMKCINCGDITDHIINYNRFIQSKGEIKVDRIKIKNQGHYR